MRLWLGSTRGFRRFTRGSGVPRLRRSALAAGLSLLAASSYSIRSEAATLVTERLEFDMLFRWFVGLTIDEKRVRRPRTFSKNRDRLVDARDRAGVSCLRFLGLPEVKGLLSGEHFFGRRDFAQGLGVDEELPSQRAPRAKARGTARSRSRRLRGATARPTSATPSARTKRTPRRPTRMRAVHRKGAGRGEPSLLSRPWLDGEPQRASWRRPKRRWRPERPSAWRRRLSASACPRGDPRRRQGL